MNRRDFLLGSGALAASSIGMPVALAGTPNYKWQTLMAYHDRKLNLVRGAESFSGTYWTPQDGLLVKPYVQVCALLRDVKAARIEQISTGVLEILFCIQTWLRHSGVNTPIHVLSGYRTKLTNAGIEGSARASLHMQGRAIDVWVPGIPTAVLANMALAFEGGGVGYYPSKKMIHIDDGNYRLWKG